MIAAATSASIALFVLIGLVVAYFARYRAEERAVAKTSRLVEQRIRANIEHEGGEVIGLWHGARNARVGPFTATVPWVLVGNLVGAHSDAPDGPKLSITVCWPEGKLPVAELDVSGGGGEPLLSDQELREFREKPLLRRFRKLGVPLGEPPYVQAEHLVMWEEGTFELHVESANCLWWVVAVVSQPMAIRGGAWLTRAYGGSDVLRGLAVYLCTPFISMSDIDTEEFHEMMRPLERLSGNQVMKLLQQWPENEVPIVALYPIGRVARLRGYEYFWPSVVAKTLVAEGYTDINGNYEIREVPPGQYVLYAAHVTDISTVEWLIPVTLMGGRELRVDLCNDNAEPIQTR